VGSLKPPAGRSIEDPHFILPEEPPFSPGSGPFRIKGWGYQGDVRFYDEHVPGGAEAVAHAVRDPAVGAFLLRKFEPDAWYDVVPKLYQAQAAAKLRGISYEKQCAEASRWHAQDKFSGIYRPLLRVASSEMLAVWIPRLSSSFYDFGSTESRVVGPKVVKVTRYGVPRVAVLWWAHAASSYFEYVIGATGARHPHVRWHPTLPDGERMGMELVKMPFELTWA
jgi:hypothetical protein